MFQCLINVTEKQPGYPYAPKTTDQDVILKLIPATFEVRECVFGILPQKAQDAP